MDQVIGRSSDPHINLDRVALEPPPNDESVIPNRIDFDRPRWTYPQNRSYDRGRSSKPAER